MTIGNENPVINRQQAKKKKEAVMARAFPQGVRCHRCLGYGHWSYECKGKRKHLVRPSRTQILKQNMKQQKEGECSSGNCKIPRKKKKLSKDCSDSSDCSTKSGDDADRSSSSVSSSDSSFSDSDSDSDSSSNPSFNSSSDSSG